MIFRRSLKFAAVSARTCAWTADLHMLMPGPTKRLESLSTPLPLRIHPGTQGEVSLGLVDTVERRGGEVLAYGRLTRGAHQEWHAIEMYLGREFIVPDIRYLDVEECSDGRRRVWDWTVTGFMVTRYPPWSDLPTARVEQNRSSW